MKVSCVHDQIIIKTETNLFPTIMQSGTIKLIILSKLSWDIIGSLPVTAKGHKYVLHVLGSN